MPEPTTERTLPEIGTLKYNGAQATPKGYVPINFNGLSLGGKAQSQDSMAHRLSDRLLRGIEVLTSFQPKDEEPAPEAPTPDMGVIRYHLPSPIQSYRIQRQRRNARLKAYGRPLLIAACLAVAVPVGAHWVGSLAPSTSASQVASTAQASTPAQSPVTPAQAAVAPATELPAEPAVQAVPAAEPAAEAPRERLVTVKSGDTLGGIAHRNGLTAKELARYNGMKDLDSLKIGQELRVPLPQPAVAQAADAQPAAVQPAAVQPPVAKAEPEAKVAAFVPPAVPLVLAPKAEGQPAPSTQLAAQAEQKPKAKPTGPKTYTIRSGDSLSKIANRFGIKTATLASANGLSDDETLSVGKQLKVPQGDGIYVKLRSGESLSHLASRYGVKVSAIQEANGITNPTSLREGQSLFLPGAEAKKVTRESRRERGEFKQASRGLIGDLGRAVGKKFVWPTAGRISSYFGARGGRQHSGVDIPRPKGSPIHAAKSGTVISAGWNGDYGKCVDISHGGGVVTRYAHCSKIAVKPGDTVSKGELIGLVGDTGRATGPHLHYEVRINGRAVNPSKFH